LNSPINRRRFVQASALVAGARLLPRDSTGAAGFKKFRIWDAHCHLGGKGATPAQRAGELLAVARRMGVEKVLIAMGHTPHLADPTPAQLIEKNNDMMAALEAFPKETLGLVYVSPKHAAASVTEMDRCLKHPRVVGLKLWIAAKCSVSAIDPIIKHAAAHRVTIHQHVWDKAGGNNVGESKPEDLAALARRHPKVQFIAMHSGGNWERGLRALRTVPNVSAEVAGSEPVAGFVEMAVRELGADRVIWASDAGGRSFASQLAKVYEARIPDAAKQKILCDNFREQAERAMRFKKN
jgi:predicted TIM-barrel fold metal-dependent hydrolase